MQLRLVLEVMHTPQCLPNEGSWLGCTGWESCRSHHAGLRGRLYLCPCRPVLNVQVAGVLYYTTLRVLQWCCKMGGIIEFSMQRPSLYSAFPLNTSWLWSGYLLSFVGTYLSTCRPTKLGKGTVTAPSKAVNESKSWRRCTRGGPGAVPPTPFCRGQLPRSTPCPSTRQCHAGLVGPHR